MPYSLKVRSIGNACITRYNQGEAADLKTIIETNYPNLTAAEKQQVREYVASIRPDIPYEVTPPVV